MPKIIKPEHIPDVYKDYLIVKDLNIVPCVMSEIQYEKYQEAFKEEKSLDRFRKSKQSYDDDDPYHYQIRTRQSCNVVYRDDDFRVKKLPDDKLTEIKMNVYTNLLENRDMNIENDLKNLES